MENIERVYQFLEEAGTYYLATMEGDQPRVRPFGTVLLYEGKLYIQTGKIKPASSTMTITGPPRKPCSTRCLHFARCITKMMATPKCFTLNQARLPSPRLLLPLKR